MLVSWLFVKQFFGGGAKRYRRHWLSCKRCRKYVLLSPDAWVAGGVLSSASGMNCLLVFPIWGTYPLLHGREDLLAIPEFTVGFTMSTPDTGGGFHENIL
jgi:hypothetical protein